MKNPIKWILNRVRQERKEEIANKYNCKNCMHYGNFEAFYGEVYACKLYECHYKRKERVNDNKIQ